MGHTRTYLQKKLQENNNVIDHAKWHFHNKNSKRIWNTLLWLYKNNLLSEKGLETYNHGYKGNNSILKISQDDLTEDGIKVMDHCYRLIGDKFDKVDTVLSRCYKKL